MKNRKLTLLFALATLLSGVMLEGSATWAQTAETYDIVLQGGRVMDPESGLDAVLNVGVRGDRIAEISEQTLRGREVLNASGLVVAPGFIDLHAHGQTNRANEFQAHDGVTTALELESGKAFLRQWLELRSGNAVINFGASVAHGGLRWMAMERYADQARRVERMEGRDDFNHRRLGRVLSEVREARYHALNAGEIKDLIKRLQAGLGAGGSGNRSSGRLLPGRLAG